MKKYFLEIPVYRLEEVLYFEQMKAHIQESIPAYEGSEQLLKYRLNNPGMNHPDEKMIGNISLEFGGPWRYNEIIGYLRLHLYHNKIRVEYWQVHEKRIVKTRKKIFGGKNYKFVDEIKISDMKSKSEIKISIERAIEACGKKLKGRYLCLSSFHATKDYIDWAEMLEAL